MISSKYPNSSGSTAISCLLHVWLVLFIFLFDYSEGTKIMKNRVWTDADLDNCIFFQTVVEVSFGGELADQGLIQDYTDESIKINGWHYLRCNCTIITCGNR